MSFCIIYLASPRRFKAGDILRKDVLRVSYHITRQHFPTTDIFIFHEDYTEEDKQLFPGVKEFIQVDFSGFDSVHNPTFGRKGYLMMCRFFCGPLQSYPQLQQYSHYMRLDDDSFFIEPYLTEQLTKQKLLTNTYIYRSVFIEHNSQQTLLQFTMHFLKNIYGVDFITMNNLKNKLEQEKVTKQGIYSGLAPYNNFHICPLELWRLPIVRMYLEEIEKEHGCLRYGWMDANIHAMILYVLSKVDKRIQHCLDMSFGYKHNIHVLDVNTFQVYKIDNEFFPKNILEQLNAEILH